MLQVKAMKSAGAIGRQLEALEAEEGADPASPEQQSHFHQLPEANYKSTKVALERKLRDGINTNTLPKSFPKVDSAEAVVRII